MKRKWLLGVLVFAVVALIVVFLTFKSLFSVPSPSQTPVPVAGNEFKMKQIENENEYLSYLQKAQAQQNFNNQLSPAQPLSAVSKDLGVTESTGAGAGRQTPVVSQTNVQVVGVDEADIVKTDGRKIYVSNDNPNLFYGKRALPEISIAPYPQTQGKIHVAGVDPLSNFSSLDLTGEMYLKDSTLVVLGDRDVMGYDVSDAKNPKLLWKNLLDDGVYLITSRLIDDDLYLFTRTTSRGCAIPLFRGGYSVTCTNVYRPWAETDAQAVFSILKLDLKKGEVQKELSFLGSESSSVVYVSSQNAYVTYANNLDFYLILSEFYQTLGKGFLSTQDLAQIKALDSLEISNQAKLTEISVLVENYKKTLSADDLMAYESNSQNKMTTYMNQKMDEIYRTAVVKIALSNLEINGSAVFGGYPLNQFSLDEYQDTLRVAATNGSGVVETETQSTIFVYDQAMKLLGKVTGLGKGEKIYAVRFVDSLAYVVTFRQTDPFYVVDLKNPKKPEVVGELKIPGFSSYLHPLSGKLILGLGREDGKVKLSLFDVSDPKNPIELDKYLTNFYWSEALDNHKAFLNKTDDQIFFLPGDLGGYIFSYAGSRLNLTKTVAQNNLKRAVYIGKNWFFVSGDGIRQYDASWKEISRLVWP